MRCKDPHRRPRKLSIACLLCLLVLAPRVRADVAVIVSASNHESMDTVTLAKIFMAQIYAFPNGDSAQPIYQKVGSPVDQEFTGKLVKSMTVEVRRIWAGLVFTGGARRPRVFNSDDDVIEFVASNPHAIGYVNPDKVHGDVRVIMKL